MLVSKKATTEINDSIDSAYLILALSLIGMDFMTPEERRKLEGMNLVMGQKSLIDLMYVVLRNNPSPLPLSRLLEQANLSGIMPIVNDTNQYTIDHAKLQINEALENAKREAKKRITQEVLNANNNYKTELEVARVSSLGGLEDLRKTHLSKLLVGLAGITVLQSEFLKTFTTALTNFINGTLVDSATMAEARPMDIIVYKTVLNDTSLCTWCRKFYLNSDGSPKEFSLRELQANGSNDGKPKSQWKPTVGATHLRCRCQLHSVR